MKLKLPMLPQNPCSLIRSSWAAVQTNHFLRFPFFFFATVSAAGTVCSGSEKSLTSASSSWILCIVCETLAMIRAFWSSVTSGCFASTCVEIKI